MKKFTVLLICLLTAYASFAQSSVWNTFTLPLTRDTISQEDMTGATAAVFNTGASNATGLISFPSGFEFRFGMASYSQFSISAYGYIKMGGIPFTVNPTLQDSIISALYAFPSTYTTCSYKLVGSAPNRRFVIEWNGTLSQSGPAKFQLWLYERTGTIQFLYNTIKSYALGNAYMIYLRTNIFGVNSIASVRTLPNNQAPIANYNQIEANNYDSIYAKSRFTFQPDTVKPVKPGNLRFANVLPGCFDVVFTDSSVNESVFRLEKLDAGPDYYLRSPILSTSTLTTGANYTTGESRMQPDSLYKYRVFASNGFVNSDTVYNSIRTPMPLIFGTKKIPGDYSSINALLQDADCKHIGPNLIIELQNNYSYALESTPVRFRRNLQTKILRSVTIQPAADANLTLTSSAAAPLFTIDSVKYIGFDGRPGGAGSTIGLTIRQLDTLRPAISYVYYADSGRIAYCNIDGRSFNANYGLVYLGFRDAQWNNFPPGVNGTTISHCRIGPSAGFSDNLLVIDNNGRGDSILAESNEFFRFRTSAVLFNFGGSLSRFTRNRFYQPDAISGNTAAFKITDNQGICIIDSNRIGGSAAVWGSGKWNSYGFSQTIPLIDYSGAPQSTGIIKGNEFGNISLTGGTLEMIRGNNARFFIDGNKFGTADSLNSVVSEGHHYTIWLSGTGNKTVTNNFFSGLSADYPDQSGNQDLAMVVAFFQDSLIVRNNDFGGSNNRLANYAGGSAWGMALTGIRNLVAINNEFRGITSKNKHVFGIEEEWFGGSPTEKNMIADSNRIHHLQGKLTVYGIYANLESGKINHFNNNTIYALRAVGPYAAIGASQPAYMSAIAVNHYLWPDVNGVIDSSLVEVSNNKIYSLEYTYTPPPVYIYEMTGIAVSGRKLRVTNNMLQLGLDANGQPTDSIELHITGIEALPVTRAEVEHNSIYIGGRGEYSSGFELGLNSFTNGNKNMFVTNNIIRIERNYPSQGNDNPYFVKLPYNPVNSIVANKNIWYSQFHTDVAARLAAWRSLCACDSATVIADPKFILPGGDSAHQDLHLQAGSPADSSGTPSVSNPITDIDGQVRLNYSPTDIGADAVTPCGTNQTTVVNLTPNQSNVEICPGGNLQLSATVIGGPAVSVQWQRNLNDIAGATGLTYTATSGGSYRMVARLTCGNTASPTIIVTEGPSPIQVTLQTTTTPPYCDSSSLSFRANFNSNAPNPPQIRWYRNNVLQAGLTNTTATIDGIRSGDRIRVEVQNTYSCGIFTGKDSVTIGTMSLSYRPKIQINRYDTTRCNSNTDTIRYKCGNVPFYLPVGVQFMGAVPGATFSNLNDSVIVLQNLPPGNIQFRLYNLPSVLSCFYPDTSAVKTITVISTTAPVATLNGNSITSSAAANNQWYSTPDNIIPGAVNQTYTPTVSGSYFVRVVSGNCVSAKSNTVDFIVTGVTPVDPARQEMQLFPNPTSGQIWLKSELISGLVRTELYDAGGRVIQNDHFMMQRNTPATISAGKHRSGIFMLKVITSKQTYLFRIAIIQ